MAFELSVDQARSIVIVTHRGESSVEECQQVLAAIMADERIGPEFGLLLDVRLIEFEPTMDEIRGLGEAIGEHMRGRVAMLTASPLQYGIARQSEVFGELLGANIEVFLEYEAAMKWLAVGADFDPLSELQGD